MFDWIQFLFEIGRWILIGFYLWFPFFLMLIWGWFDDKLEEKSYRIIIGTAFVLSPSMAWGMLRYFS
jgi:hypothetical protein